MIIGTAGHIDHGKTSLVKALTGVDTDRLKEEQARGITIDLGFAYTPLPNGEVLGFVDVPGHDRLVHNMLAGATGIDFVLLVIAADDGPMPQTREHLAILDLLGLSRGAVALTKIDRVAPERLAAAVLETRALLSHSKLAGSLVFPLSTVTGEGVPELSAYLGKIALQWPARRAAGHFRLAVDRSFALDGVGIIATGSVCSGRVSIGDKLLVAPAGIEVRVRGIHAQNRPSEQGCAGQRCALNLVGSRLERDHIRRGDWLLEAPIHAPVQRFDARLELLDTEPRPLRSGTPVHLHLGASDILARVALLEGDAIQPGGAALVHIVADKPVCALNGDRYILRDQSATRTVGGGVVADPFPPARNRRTPARLAELRNLLEADHAAALARALEHASTGLDLGRFSQSRNLRPEEAEALCQAVPMRVAATGSGTFAFTPEHWVRMKQAVFGRLAAEHEQTPDSPGPDRVRLHRMAMPQLARPAFFALLEELLLEGAIAQSGPWLHLPAHRVTLTDFEKQLWQRIQPLLQQEPLHPPRVRDIAGDLDIAEDVVRMALRKIARAGEVYLVAHDHYYTKEAVGELFAIVRTQAEADGRVRASEFRDRIGTGRKLAIQILEFFDRMGYTRRTGDEHRVRGESLSP